MTTNPQPKDDKNMIFRNGEWIRKTGKPAMSDRPLPAPGDVDDMAWLEPVILSVIREWNELMMFGEWVGSTIYIRVNGKDTTTKLDGLLKWYHENQYIINRTNEVERLKGNLAELWDKHNRLLTYLELEDVTQPKSKLIRKAKKDTK